MALMDFETYGATVRHGPALPDVTADGGSVDIRLPPQAASVSPQLQLASDYTLHNRNGHDGQELPALVSDNNTTHSVSIDLTLAAEGKALVDELLRRVLADTDFLADLTPDLDLLESNVSNSVLLAADIWADANGDRTVPLPIVEAARAELEMQAHDMLRDMAELAADALRDSQEAGDLGPDGRWVPYPRYVGV
jgi:hypothetical protein